MTAVSPPSSWARMREAKMGEGLDNYGAMLDRELVGKKRSTVIAGLQAHRGGE